MGIAADILEGLDNALAHAKGDDTRGRASMVEVPTIDVKALRRRLDMTQTEFAATFGFSVGAVRNWEQRTRRPERTARVLLAVIEREPEVVMKALDELASPAA